MRSIRMYAARSCTRHVYKSTHKSTTRPLAVGGNAWCLHCACKRSKIAPPALLRHPARQHEKRGNEKTRTQRERDRQTESGGEREKKARGRKAAKRKTERDTHTQRESARVRERGDGRCEYTWPRYLCRHGFECVAHFITNQHIPSTLTLWLHHVALWAGKCELCRLVALRVVCECVQAHEGRPHLSAHTAGLHIPTRAHKRIQGTVAHWSSAMKAQR